MKTLRYILAALALCLLPISAQAANRFAVCSTTCTWDGSSTAMWSTTTGGSTGASVPGSGDAVIFDGATCVGGTTCTTTVNTTVTIQSLTFGACTASTTGCIIDFSANNNNVNIVNAGGIATFDGHGSGTRNLKMGSGTWTIGSSASSSNFTVNFLTTSGLTFAGSSAPLVLVGANVPNTNLYFGGLSWGALTLTGNATYPATVWAFESGNPASDTFASLTLNAPIFVNFRFSQTYTFTAGITVNGASWTTPIYLSSDSNNNNQQATLASGAAASFGYVVLHNITGATSTITVNPAVNLGSNGGTLSLTNPGTGGGGFIIGQ